MHFLCKIPGSLIFLSLFLILTNCGEVIQENHHKILPIIENR